MANEGKKNYGYILKVKEQEDGEELFHLNNSQIKGYRFIMNSPNDVETKANNIMAELHIEGEFNDNTDDPIPKKIVEWSLTHTATGRAFKYLQFDYTVDGVVKRRYIFPNAFVVDFEEKRGVKDCPSGRPCFELFIKQNKDDLDEFIMESGIAADEEEGENE